MGACKRTRLEKEKKENVWRRNFFFAEEKSFGKEKCHDTRHTHRQTDRHCDDRTRILDLEFAIEKE